MCHTVTRRAVLCIGNDVETRSFLQATFTEYELVFAPNAFEAIRNMHARAFDAYVTDYWLPDWTGPQLCRAVRDVDAHCPIIFWSAATGDSNRQRAKRAGASAFLCKDDDADQLRPELGRLLALGDAVSLNAKIRMEHAVVSEIERCESRLQDRAPEKAVSFVERTARSRGYKAFVDSGGSRAHFERWWPQVFGTARANHNLVTA